MRPLVSAKFEQKAKEETNSIIAFTASVKSMNLEQKESLLDEYRHLTMPQHDRDDPRCEAYRAGIARRIEILEQEVANEA